VSRDLSSYYTADERTALARATESAVLQSLTNAQTQPEREDHWRAHADRLERNFTADFGRHYSYFTARQHGRNGDTYP